MARIDLDRLLGLRGSRLKTVRDRRRDRELLIWEIESRTFAFTDANPNEVVLVLDDPRNVLGLSFGGGGHVAGFQVSEDQIMDARVNPRKIKTSLMTLDELLGRSPDPLETKAVRVETDRYERVAGLSVRAWLPGTASEYIYSGKPIGRIAGRKSRMDQGDDSEPYMDVVRAHVQAFAKFIADRNPNWTADEPEDDGPPPF